MALNKLVRDNIPDIIKADGQTPNTRVLSQSEYIVELEKKLQEEVTEYLCDKNTEELADILEVIYALAKTHNTDRGELEEIRAAKATKNGGFKDKIFLISIDKH